MKHIPRIFTSLSLVALISLGLGQDAQAGIIITDGKTGGRIPITSTPVADDSKDDDKRAQEIYLWASMVFGGHVVDDGNSEVDENGNVVMTPRDRLGNDIPRSAMMDDVSGEPMGGCAATPGAPYALAALFLILWRGRGRRVGTLR